MMMVDAQGWTWDAFNSDHLADLITEKTGVPAELALSMVALLLAGGRTSASIDFTTAETSQLTSIDGCPVPGQMFTKRITWTIETGSNGRHPRYWLHRQPQEA